MKFMRICVIIGMLILHGVIDASCAPSQPGVNLWNIVADDFVIDCETFSKVSSIESKIDAITSCGSTPIEQDDVEITTPGIYCLANDIQGTVTISSSDVTFDLNGHTISGVITTAPSSALRNIVIKNGIIQVPASPDGLVGITISGIDANNRAENIVLADLAIYCNGVCAGSLGGEYGILIDYAKHVVISDVYITDAVGANCQIDNSANVRIEASDFLNACSTGASFGNNGLVDNLALVNCNFNENVITGLECVSVANSRITNCNFTGNANGVRLLGDSNNVTLNNCLANNNSTTGFYVGEDAIRIVANGCQAKTNLAAHGFHILGNAQQLSFINCLAYGNRVATSYGFYIINNAQRISLLACQAYAHSNGFFIRNNVQQLNFVDCIASENVNYGFWLRDSVQDVNFTGCKSMISNGFTLTSDIQVQRVNITDCVARSGGSGFSASADGVNLTRCLAQSNVVIGGYAISTGSIVLDNCASDANLTGFFCDALAAATFNECLATRNTTGFNDVAGAASACQYVSCYANDNPTNNYNPSSGTPFDAVDATTAGINYWDNTFSS